MKPAQNTQECMYLYIMEADMLQLMVLGHFWCNSEAVADG